METDDYNLIDEVEPNRLPAADSFGTPTRRHPLLDGLGFWCFVGLGTAAAGGLFGFLLGCLSRTAIGAIVGLIIGCIFAGACAVPVVVTVAVLVWAMWLSRFRLLVGGFAGGLTGLVATGFLSSLEVSLFVAGAGLLGMLGGSLGGLLYSKKIRFPERASSISNLQPWQFTLRDLFARMTVLAMLISAWTWAVKSVHHSRQESIRAAQEYEAQSDDFKEGSE